MTQVDSIRPTSIVIANRRGKLNRLLFYLVVVTITIVVVYPFYWMVMASFTPEGYSLAQGPLFLPGKLSTEAYKTVFAEKPIGTWLWNTVVVTLGATAIVLPVALMAAYSMTRYRFRGKILFVFFVLSSQLLPASALIVPFFLIFRDYGLLDTVRGVTLSYTTFMLPMAIWVMWGYMQTVPIDFEEAALVDGCTKFGAFVRVTLPLAMPGIAATALFIFLEGWNHYLLGFILTSSTDKWVISLGLYSFIGQYNIQIEQMMATSFIAALPALLVFGILQRFLQGGLALGGLKG
jgi:multiple sugar transport system permease protein